MGILVSLLFAATSIAAGPENSPPSREIDIPRGQLSTEQQKKVMQMLAEAQPPVMTFAAAFPDASFRVWRLDSKSQQHVLIDMEEDVHHEYRVALLYEAFFDQNFTKMNESRCSQFDVSVISDLTRLHEGGVYQPVKLTLEELQPLCADPEGFLQRKIGNKTEATGPCFFRPEGWALGTEFPARPRSSEQSAGEMFIYEISNDEAFTFFRAINPAPISQDRLTAAYNGAKKGMLDKAEGTLISEENISILGHDSRHYVYSTHNGELIFDQRMVIIKDELYIFMYIHPKDHYNAPAASAFFNEISDKKVDGPVTSVAR